MENEMSKETAIKVINQYSDLLMQYENLGVTGVYLVGSLADGNYIPGKSDLDVSVIVSNECDMGKIEEISERIIGMLKSKYGITIDFEAFIKKEEMLYPPYEAEKQKTIELMRIKNQAQKIAGSFNEEDIPTPEKKFFVADEMYAEEKLKRKMGENIFDKMSEKQLFNYVVNYMRLHNIVYKDECMFNKKKIIELYCDTEDESTKMQEILDSKDKSPYKEYLLQMAAECKKRKLAMFKEFKRPDFDEVGI